MADLASRLADLRAKLKARAGNAAYRDNVTALKAEIARLEALEPGNDG